MIEVSASGCGSQDITVDAHPRSALNLLTRSRHARYLQTEAHSLRP